MTDVRSRVAVVTPVYRSELDESERISLRHLNHFLGAYDRYLVMPRSLRGGPDGFAVRRFPDRYFESSRTYSALLVSSDFYGSFSAYEYILIYQLDALVFGSELGDWCAKGYDYIGAVHSIGDQPPCAGQGGFSLRRIQAFLDVLRSRVRAVDPAEWWRRNWGDRSAPVRWWNMPRRWAKHFRRFNDVRWDIRRRHRSWEWPEDWFWSLAAQTYDPAFRLAPVEEGHRFAFAEEPRRALAAAGGRLPFGCHGWPKERDFWAPYLLPPED